MTKKVFNRFDPFMPSKIDNAKVDNANSLNNSHTDILEDFNKATLNEGLHFGIPGVKNGFVIMISKKAIGSENGLGEKLLEDFICSLSSSFELPQYLIFSNEAVFLLDSEKIKNAVNKLKKYGVKNLVSVESLNFFNYEIRNKSVIYATSGDITEKLLISKQLISL